MKTNNDIFEVRAYKQMRSVANAMLTAFVVWLVFLLLTGCAWNVQKFYHTGLRKYAYKIDCCPVYFWNPFSADPFERIGE